jgi:hypothetical protein
LLFYRITPERFSPDWYCWQLLRQSSSRYAATRKKADAPDALATAEAANSAPNGDGINHKYPPKHLKNAVLGWITVPKADFWPRSSKYFHFENRDIYYIHNVRLRRFNPRRPTV